MITHEVIRGTTTAGGAATVDSRPMTGEILAVFVDGTNLTDNADLTIIPQFTDVDGAALAGESIINNGDIGNATMNAFYPRRFGQDNAGTDLAVATGQKVAVPYVVSGQVLRATVAAGGSTQNFAITVVLRQ